MSTTLLITNDFPPRTGGIERYCAALVELLDGDVTVLTSRTPGRRADERRADSEAGIRIERRGPVLLPTPATTRAAVGLLREEQATRVLFGAAAPLALMAPALRAAGAQRIVACTHGHEVGWARLPGARAALALIGDNVDALGVITDATGRVIASALHPQARERIFRLPPPLVAPPSTSAAARTSAAGASDARTYATEAPADQAPAAEASAAKPPLVLSVGRLVRRKGFDLLLEAWGQRRQPGRLVIVGDGPERDRLERQRRLLPDPGSVVLAGRVDDDALRALYAEARVFALACRDRGLELEGFGYVFAEAQAAGIPVIAGNSGGAPEALDDGRTGYVVDTSAPRAEAAAALAARLDQFLGDPALARRMGAAGPGFVAQFGPGPARATLRRALALE